MPVISLNKVVAIFIVGGAPVSWLLLRYPNLSGNALESAASAILLIPLYAMFGTILESLADIVRSYLIRLSKYERSYAAFFGHGRDYDSLQAWKNELFPLLEKHAISARLHDNYSGKDQKLSILDFAAGYFLRKANKDQIDWLNSHYSSYTLASSLSCTLLVVFILDLTFFWASPVIAPVTFRPMGANWAQAFICAMGLELVIVSASVYLLLRFAIDMHLYSYRIAVRFAVEEIADANQSGTASDREVKA